jgi:hypothetical protein
LISSIISINIFTNLINGGRIKMKKNKLFFSVLALSMFLFYNIGYSQDNIHNDIRSAFMGKAFTEQQIMTPGDSCSVTNPERHDGFAHANGYCAFTDSTRMVLLFHPQSYPWNYTKVCIGWTSIGGVASLTYRIVMYDSGAGGMPNNILYYSAPQTATSVPGFPLMNWYSSALALPTVTSTMRAVYIGVVWDNNPATNCYLSMDENASTPLWPGWYGVNITFPATWQTIQSVAGFSAYKCVAARTEGSSASVNLCEDFSGSTFPPAGWTITGAGSAFWLRATVSSFGLGTGSAEYDMWNAPGGQDANLNTLTFTPSGVGGALFFSMAFAPYPASPPYSQDSLVILASTDGGSTYTSVVRLGPTQMQTAPALSSQFTPTASQWVKKQYALPTGTNKLSFLGRSGFGNDLFIDSICVGFPTGVTPVSNQVPQVYSLAQNYPNPFNPSTTFKFGIPKTGLVKLVVYDIIGREVQTLVNEVKNAGSYSVTFDASKLSSGVYFYKLISNDFVDTKKMVLIK